jgi:hypothetical protein
VIRACTCPRLTEQARQRQRTESSVICLPCLFTVPAPDAARVLRALARAQPGLLGVVTCPAGPGWHLFENIGDDCEAPC